MENYNRRYFLRQTLVAGTLLPVIPALGIDDTSENGHSVISPKKTMPDNAVVLFQGDSITDGNRGRTPDPNHIMGHGYAFCLAARLGADHPGKNYHFVNNGNSGDKIIDLEKRWETDVLLFRPEILSILVGVNDAASVVSNWNPVVKPKRYHEIFRKLLSQTLEVNANTTLVLGEPFILLGARTTDQWNAYVEDIQQRQEIVRQLTLEFNAIFIPFQSVFDNACQLAPETYWIWDGVHPTVAGHELMAREWIKQVSKRVAF
jgi:lysophospholipase L1-like esterase